MNGEASYRRAGRFLLGELRPPALDKHRELVEDQPAGTDASGLTVTFLGVSTLAVTDGTTTLLTDGFFSRPGLLKARFGTIAPDRRRVESALARAGLDSVDALFVAHSHFDHAMDAGMVASLTGATIVGSGSTRNIVQADNIGDDRFIVPTPGDPLELGDFTVTTYPAVHSPGDIAPGTVDTALGPDPHFDDYKTGDCYSFHITHGGQSLLIHASANFIPGQLQGVEASTVYLGIGVLGKQTPEFMDEYWREVVQTTGAERVVVIHWDNFFRSLDRPLKPIPRPGDNFDRTITHLKGRAAEQGVELVIPRLGVRADPFRSHLVSSRGC